MAPIDDYDRPIMAPPPGFTSNFDNPESEVKPIVATDSVMLTFTVLFVAVRLYTKTRITRNFGVDDYLCIAAFILAVAHSVFSHLSVTVGYGRHLWDLRAVEMTVAHVRIISAQTFMYFLAIGVVKISILAFYLRVFSVDRKLARLVYGGMAVIGVAYLGLTINAIVLLFECSSVDALSKKYCYDQYLPILIGGLFNIISDFYVLLLPVPRIWKLQTTRKRKIGILAILTVGFIASLTSIVRLILLGLRITSPDYLWNPGMNELNIVEMDLGIMTSCMPTFPAFFGKTAIFHPSTYRSLRDRLTPTSWRSYGRSSKGSSRGSSRREKLGHDASPRSHSPASSSDASSRAGAREKCSHCGHGRGRGAGPAKAWYDRETVTNDTLRSSGSSKTGGSSNDKSAPSGRGWKIWRSAGSSTEASAAASSRGGLPTTRRAEAGSFDEAEEDEFSAAAAAAAAPAGGWRLWRPTGGHTTKTPTARGGLHTTCRAEAGSFCESEEGDVLAAGAPAGGPGRPMSFVHRPPKGSGENHVAVTAPPEGVVEPWAHGGIKKLVDYEVSGDQAV